MKMVLIFWFLTFICIVSALAFVLPPLWLSAKNISIGSQKQQILTILLILILPFAAYSIYWYLGSSAKLKQYYSHATLLQRENDIQMRPYYARLQRELVKDRLNLAIDPKNIDLIINFAEAHSKLANGVLSPDIKTLLNSVLKAVPEQITVLNLLAVNAYKTESYVQAVDYWQRILSQFTPQMRDSEAEKIIKDKIKHAKAQANLFESRQTK